MRITCPSCSTSYTIPDDKIGAKGRSVRCASCGTKWQVSAVEEVAEIEGAFEAEAFAGFASPGESVSAGVEAGAATRMFDVEDVRSDKDIVSSAGARASDRAEMSGEDPSGEALDASEPGETTESIVAAAAAKIDIETLAKKPQIKAVKPKRAKQKKSAKFDFERFLVRARPVFGAGVLVLSIGVVGLAVALRAPMVSAFPSLASLYAMVGLPVNLRGLDIGHLKMMREVDNGQPVLVVEGELTNATAAERDVPGIRFALRGDDSQEIYAWSIEPKQTMLTPGATLRFRSRLASPPEQAADIQVRMIDRRIRQASLND